MIVCEQFSISLKQSITTRTLYHYIMNRRIIVALCYLHLDIIFERDIINEIYCGIEHEIYNVFTLIP